jgi:hypothetical protein
MAKIKKPTKADYEKQSKGQGIGTLIGQSTSVIVHT